MSKASIVFNFTVHALFWGVIAGAVLGGFATYSPNINWSAITAGVLNGVVSGGMAGLINGIVLGLVTVRFFHPLQTRKGYRGRITLYALLLSVSLVLLLMWLISRQPNSDLPLARSSLLLFTFVPAAPILGYFAASWYLKSQTPIE